jgi:hypothetical protein
MAAVAWAAIALLAATIFGSFLYLGNRIDALGARIDVSRPCSIPGSTASRPGWTS